MSKKTIKAAKTASKTTKATADKAARAKELKRIRDAKYRAKKAAAKAQAKTQAKTEPHISKGGRAVFDTVIVSTLLAQGLALESVVRDKRVPDDVRALCNAAWKVGGSAVQLLCGKEGK